MHNSAATSDILRLCRRKSCRFVTTSSMRSIRGFSSLQTGAFSGFNPSADSSCSKRSMVNDCLKLIKPNPKSNEENMSDGIAIIHAEPLKRKRPIKLNMMEANEQAVNKYINHWNAVNFFPSVSA